MLLLKETNGRKHYLPRYVVDDGYDSGVNSAPRWLRTTTSVLSVQAMCQVGPNQCYMQDGH